MSRPAKGTAGKPLSFLLFLVLSSFRLPCEMNLVFVFHRGAFVIALVFVTFRTVFDSPITGY
jgi:hypothetical protein